MPSNLEKQLLAAARSYFAAYLAIIHKTDTEWVYGGSANPISAPHLKRICDRMQQVAGWVLRTDDGWKELGNERHTSVVAPPGSAKTTLLGAFYEWLIGKASLCWGRDWAEHLHLGHVSNSADQARRVSFAVRDTVLDNQLYASIFPAVRLRADKAAESEWRVEGCRGLYPTFTAMGVGGPLLGTRLNFLGLDDLIKQEDVKAGNVSATEVEFILSWLRMTALRRLQGVPGACAWDNATRWMERDPPAWYAEQGWTQYTVKALGEDGESFWPQRYPLAELLKEKEADPEAFALQFQGEPMPEEGIFFRMEHFSEPYDQDKLPAAGARNFWLVSSWDTAGTTNPRSDYTAGWTAAIDLTTWDIYLLNLYHDKLEFSDVLAALRGNQHYFRCHAVLIEDKATGQPAAQMLRREGVPVIALKPFGERGQAKLAEVMKQVQPLLAARRVHLPSQRFAQAHGLAWLPLAMRQLLGYPRTRHDDIARALIQLLWWAVQQQRAGTWEQWAKPQRAIPWGARREERAVV